MKYIYPLVVLVLFHASAYSQVVTLPINFEGGVVTTANFTGFGGGTATVIDNPFVDVDNNSVKVARMVRTPATNFAGAFLDLSAPLIFSATSTICMKVYTTAPVGTPVVLKLEDGGAFVEISQLTTVSGGWQTLCFDPPGAPTNFTRLTFLFNLGISGNGTYYFDDIEQPVVLTGNEVLLPLDFEGVDNAGNQIDDSNFGSLGGGFGGANGLDFGAATVIPNPQIGGLNTSATVGQIVRHPGSDQAGAFVRLPVNLNFDAYPIICMNVFTDAPVGTNVTLRIEDTDTGQPDIDAVAVTTVSGEWEPLCFVYQLAPDAYNRLTFLFDLGNSGDGSATSTFLFDDVEQLITPPGFFFTLGSAYFCPGLPVTFTFPGPGTYLWYDDLATTNLVGMGSTFTSPPLFSNTSYYVQDVSTVALPQTDVGPTLLGPADDLSGPRTATMDFNSNIDNGLWHSVDIVSKFINSPGPCTYTVTGRNLTLASSATTVRTIDLTIPANDNAKQEYLFTPPVPMNIGNSMQLEVTLTGGTGCRLRSFQLGGGVPTIPSYPSTTAGGEITYTGYDLVGTPAVQNLRWMGFDYSVSGDVFTDPTVYQVNAIADCANPLPIELLDFWVREHNGDALLAWSTASEINNDRFLLMRTKDGLEFETVGTVSGAGNSSTVLNYTFLDRDPLKGLSYYKLTQVDFDGTESSSELVAFTNESTGGFQLFPNPTSQDLTLTLGEGYDNIEVRIYDLTGRLINQHNFGLADILSFKLTGNPGTYFVEVLVDKERRETFNVMKL
ncbi:T9SS type A sorting domain-containing protein [Cryomorphaceae bacterium 1068]|nr:T9SS type A sorting domain-containing protein [Cryomorphaceae bacterium 1068]